VLLVVTPRDDAKGSLDQELVCITLSFFLRNKIAPVLDFYFFTIVRLEIKKDMALTRLCPSKTLLLVCDIQERFRTLIWRSESVIHRSALLCNACRILDIPIVVTEQNPKAFGPTVSELKETLKLEEPLIFSKRLFSMLTPELISKWRNTKGLEGRDQVILVGIEAHVCVLQTVLDLIDQQPSVKLFVVSDAVSSQRSHDRSVALGRMEKCGATISTAESIIFELLRTSEHPNFRQISSLIKETNARPNEFAHDG